jgi:hypothetical protein
MARYYGRNFSTHGNLLHSGEPITRKLHRTDLSIGPCHATAFGGEEKLESPETPSTQVDAEVYSASDRKGDSANPLNRDSAADQLHGAVKASSMLVEIGDLAL